MHFFENGLRFACQRCGKCCTGSPGVVTATDTEISGIASFMNMSANDVVSRFTRMLTGRIALKEKTNGDCIFYEGGCSIYPVRPAQCRSYPFWLKNLRSEQAWRDVALDCPGIGQGELLDREAILKRVGESPI